MTHTPFFFRDSNVIKIYFDTKDIKYQKMICGIIQYNIYCDEGIVN